MPGDYIRLLFFSEYARVLSGNVEHLKEILNPFTGCFISKIPITVVMIRQTMKAAEFFENDETHQARKFLFQNATRLDHAMDFIKGENSKLQEQVEKERKGWERFYEILDKVEAMTELEHKSLREKAGKVVKESRIF